MDMQGADLRNANIVDSTFPTASASDYRTAAGDKLLTPAAAVDGAAIVTLTDAATIAVDWSSFINGQVTLAGNRTLGNPSNAQPGTWRQIIVIQDSNGNRTLGYHANYQFPGAIVPTIATGNGAKTVLSIFCRTSSEFHVYPAIGMGR